MFRFSEQLIVEGSQHVSVCRSFISNTPDWNQPICLPTDWWMNRPHTPYEGGWIDNEGNRLVWVSLKRTCQRLDLRSWKLKSFSEARQGDMCSCHGEEWAENDDEGLWGAFGIRGGLYISQPVSQPLCCLFFFVLQLDSDILHLVQL